MAWLPLALCLHPCATAATAAERTPDAAPPAPPAPPAPATETPIEILISAPPSRLGSPRDASAAVAVLRGDALDRPGTSAAELVADSPGTQIRRTGADSDLATASLRGASAAQTPVYLAGVRLNDDVGGTADLSTIPLWMLHRVEVFRGSAPVAGDRLGLGGAIFFEPRLPRGPELRAGQLVGTHGARGSWLSGGTGDDRAAALVALRHDRAANDYSYLDDAGTRFEPSDDRRRARGNADHRTVDLWALGRYRLGPRGRLSLVYNAFSREQGVTGLSVLPATQSRARVRRELVALSTTVPCAEDEARRGGSGCHLELVTTATTADSQLLDPARELALGTTALYTAGRRWAETVRIRFSLGTAATLVVAGEQSVETLAVRRRHEVGDAFATSARRSVTRPAASFTLHPDPLLDWLGLVALECHSTSGSGTHAPCGTLEPVARTGLRVSPSRALELLANLGRTVRVPTLGEQYGVAPLVRGNAELRPETGSNLDVGLRLRGGGQRARFEGEVEAFAFRRRVQDLITYRQSFRQLVPFNLGAARIAGLELSGELRWRRALRLTTTATLQDARDRSAARSLANDQLPLQSRLVLVQSVETAVHPGSAWLDRGTLGARVRHRSSSYQDPAGLIVIPAQTTLDLDATARLLAGRLTLRAALENLWNATERDVLGLALPGRTASLSAEVSLP